VTRAPRLARCETEVVYGAETCLVGAGIAAHGIRVAHYVRMRQSAIAASVSTRWLPRSNRGKAAVIGETTARSRREDSVDVGAELSLLVA
jgi:hypothetical protein